MNVGYLLWPKFEENLERCMISDNNQKGHLSPDDMKVTETDSCASCVPVLHISALFELRHISTKHMAVPVTMPITFTTVYF
jgi:hypothetical protein